MINSNRCNLLQVYCMYNARWYLCCMQHNTLGNTGSTKEKHDPSVPYMQLIFAKFPSLVTLTMTDSYS